MKEAMKELWEDVICLVDLADKKRAFIHWKKRWIIELETTSTIDQLTIMNSPNIRHHFTKNMIHKIEKAFARFAEIEGEQRSHPQISADILNIKTQIIAKHPQCKKEY